jgi:hypothetical protein
MIFKDASGRTVICAEDRREWRGWLEENYEAADEIWFAYPPKESG